MSKRSIDKEFYPKAEAMMLSGMGQFQIVEALSKEYYDKKQIGNYLDRIVHPKARAEVLRQRKIFASVAGAILLLTGTLITVAIYIGNQDFNIENIWDFESSWFFWIYQGFISVGYLLELLPSLRASKIGYKSNILSSVVMIFLSFSIISKDPNFELWVAIINSMAWLFILVINIIWFRASKKNQYLV